MSRKLWALLAPFHRACSTYMVGVIFMLGAEVNAALMKYKVRQIIRRNISSSSSARREQVLDEPDKPADI